MEGSEGMRNEEDTHVTASTVDPLETNGAAGVSVSQFGCVLRAVAAGDLWTGSAFDRFNGVNSSDR